MGRQYEVCSILHGTLQETLQVLILWSLMMWPWCKYMTLCQSLFGGWVRRIFSHPFLVCSKVVFIVAGPPRLVMPPFLALSALVMGLPVTWRQSGTWKSPVETLKISEEYVKAPGLRMNISDHIHCSRICCTGIMWVKHGKTIINHPFSWKW